MTVVNTEHVRGDLLRVRMKVRFAMRHEKYAMKALNNSIGRLESVLAILGIGNW